MQQPTSNFYHACYGIEAGLGSRDRALTKLIYYERPEFESVGYTDKEFFYSAVVGTGLTKSRWHGLAAFVGLGQIEGYITALEEESKRTFEIAGPVFQMEYYANLGAFTCSIGHTKMVGYVDQKQLKAKVAWPYNFFQLSLGYQW